VTINDIKTLGEVAKENNIPLQTLHYRLKDLAEGFDYRRVEGLRQPILLWPSGIEKILEERR
jgi:hypothetical protein